MARSVLGSLALALLVAACSQPATQLPSVAPTLGPSPTAIDLPATAPPATASPDVGAGIVVTIEVAGGERYRILLTDPADIAVARDLLAGRPGPGIPNGKVVRGDPGVNTGYSWHIDPNDVEWADMTIELCDGKPSDVEANQISGDRFCPWSARVVAIEDAPG